MFFKVLATQLHLAIIAAFSRDLHYKIICHETCSLGNVYTENTDFFFPLLVTSFAIKNNSILST